MAMAGHFGSKWLARQSVARLDQKPAHQAFVVELTRKPAGAVRAVRTRIRVGGEYPQVGLWPQQLQCFRGVIGRDEVFEKHRRDLAGSLVVDDVVGGDGAAEGG